MRHGSYDSPEYRAKQSDITKRNQIRGIYAHLKKQEARTCARNECSNSFTVQKADPKKFCSKRCAAIFNNSRRVQSDSTRRKISASLKGKHISSPRKGLILVPRKKTICGNSQCGRYFEHEQYRERKFCSGKCAILVIGQRPTSAKASRGKSGIRPDISPTIYFHSRWEANIARLFTYWGIDWVYEPKTFDIGEQTYTPDFYLPHMDLYIEVKNFWGDHSRIRDQKFRNKFGTLRLNIILKEEYIAIETAFGSLIPSWEYKNSKFEPIVEK